MKNTIDFLDFLRDFQSFEIQECSEGQLELRDLARNENAILFPFSAQRKAVEILFDF